MVAWLQIVVGIFAALASGGLLAVPIGMCINARLTPLVALPIALLMVTGVAVVAALFFVSGSLKE